MRQIVQITISLKDSVPLVSRMILVDAKTSFFELHHIIQIVMGWKNYHLFEFNLDGFRAGMKEENEFGYKGSELLDATKLRLSDIVSLEGDSFSYIYDFGDLWVHEITVDSCVEKEDGAVYPVCVRGQMNCPPEDCGGIAGFHNVLEILQDNKHPEHKDIKNWTGQNYDARIFKLPTVNRQLKQLQKYIARWKSPG